MLCIRLNGVVLKHRTTVCYFHQHHRQHHLHRYHYDRTMAQVFGNTSEARFQYLASPCRVWCRRNVTDTGVSRRISVSFHNYSSSLSSLSTSSTLSSSSTSQHIINDQYILQQMPFVIQHTEYIYIYKTSTCFGAQVLSRGVIIQKYVGANLLIINIFLKIWLVRWPVFCFPGIIKLWLSEWLSCSSIIDRKYFCNVEKKHFFVSQPHIPAINMKEKRQIFCSIIFTCFGFFFKVNLQLLWQYSCHWSTVYWENLKWKSEIKILNVSLSVARV